MRARPLVGAVALSLLMPLAVRSQEDAEREVQLAKARQVLELSGGGTLGVQMIAQMLPALKQMAPQAPEEFWREFMAEIDPESLVDLVVPIYAKHFETAELDALIEFYSSPIGRKTVERLPAISAESMAAGQAWGEQIAKRAIEKLKAAGLQSSS
jgi:hypothetical protein